MSGLIWFDKVEAMIEKGADQPGINVFPLYQGPFPWVKDALNEDFTPGSRQDLELTSCRLFKVNNGSDEYAVVVLCRIEAGKPSWTIYCGDQQIKGAHRTDGKTLAGKVRAEGKLSNKVANALEGSDWVGKVPEMANCGFFKMVKRTGNYCSHTRAVLANTPSADFEEMATELQGWLDGADAAVATAAVSCSPEEEACLRAAWVKHVALFGERGSGKTYFARKIADRFNAKYIEVQMHPSMEAWEFQTHDRSINGQVVQVRGPFAEAVYWIRQGQKVVMCWDEFLNMNPIYQTVINSPLTRTADDTYLIRTGDIEILPDGSGRYVIEEVPCDMLWIVATSNIGARYGLDKIAPSVRARLRIILMNTNPERTKDIVERNLSKLDMPLEFGEMFKKFIEACNQAVMENTMDEEATTRLACDVIRGASEEVKRTKKSPKTAKQWLPFIKMQLMDEIAQVVNFEMGPLDSDQEARYKSLVDSCFKVR